MMKHLAIVSIQRKIPCTSTIRNLSIPSVLTSWVNGASLPAVHCETVTSKSYVNFSPSSGSSLCEVQVPSIETLEHAIMSSHSAFQSNEWSLQASAERGKVLQEMAKIMTENAEELCNLEALDTGIPISQIRVNHVAYAIQTLEYYSALAQKGFAGKMVDAPLAGGHRDSFAYTRREPLGVCAAIGGWNYPLVTMVWKMAPALAAGNTVIYKPSECTPLSSLLVAKLWTDLLPPGVLQVLSGEAETAKYLVAHPLIKKVSVTGSTATGIIVARESADTLKRLTLELGGKSPLLVFADANVESAVRVAVEGVFDFEHKTLSLLFVSFVVMFLQAISSTMARCAVIAHASLWNAPSSMSSLIG